MDLYRIYYRTANDATSTWVPQCYGQFGDRALEWTDEVEAKRCFDVLVADEKAARKKNSEPLPEGTVWVSITQPPRIYRLVKIPMAVVKEVG